MFTKPTTAAGMRRIFYSLLPVLFLAGQAPLSQAIVMELAQNSPTWTTYLRAPEKEEEEPPQPCRGDTVPEKTAVRISGKILRQDCNEHGDWGYWPEENLPRRNVALLPHGSTVIINQYRSPEGSRYRFDNSSTDAQQNHLIPLATEEEFRAFLENVPPRTDYVSVCQVAENTFECWTRIVFLPYCKEGTRWDWLDDRRCEGPGDCKRFEFWDPEKLVCKMDWAHFYAHLPGIGCGIACL